MRKSFNLQTLKRSETMVISAVVLFVALLGAGILIAGVEETWTQLQKLSLPILVGLFGLNMLNAWVRASRWHFFTRKLGVNIPYKSMLTYYFAGFSLVTTPGKIGTLLRMWLMKKLHSASYSRTSSCMFMDLLTDFISLTLLAMLGASIFTGYGWLMLLCGVFFVAAYIIFYHPKFATGGIKLAYKLSGKRSPRTFAFILKITRNVQNLFSLKLLTLTSAMSAIGWLSHVVILWWSLATLSGGFEQTVPFLTACVIFCLASLVGGFSMLPGGLGGVEATMVALLISQGVPTEIAITATAITRLMTLWSSVGIGFAILPKCLKMVKNKKRPTD